MFAEAGVAFLSCVTHRHTHTDRQTHTHKHTDTRVLSMLFGFYAGIISRISRRSDSIWLQLKEKLCSLLSQVKLPSQYLLTISFIICCNHGFQRHWLHLCTFHTLGIYLIFYVNQEMNT